VSLSAVKGQAPAIETLERALKRGKVHHAYRFEGPAGVGKELAALALAQTLVCERGGPSACEECSACKRAVTISAEEPFTPLHPDVVLVGRGVYPPSILGSGVSEATGISVEQIRRLVLGRVGYPPHEGHALVFIVRDADELTPPAANAMLKTLEEPGPRTHFILLTSRPNRLLDTVRSRTLAVRFGPLPDAVVAEILSARGLSLEVLPLARGSVSVALELADPDRMKERDEFLSGARAALAAPDLAEAISFAQHRPDKRDVLRNELGFLAQSFATESRELVGRDPLAAERAARRYSSVLQTLDEVEKNVQPALALEAMVARLRRI
jgi:DNA polymerase-3 subunit delta'